VFGLLTGTVRGLTGAGGGAALLGHDLFASPNLSVGVGVSEPGAFPKRLSRLFECLCQPLRGHARMTLGALGASLALGGRAPGRGVPSSTSRVVARLPLLEPTEACLLSLRRLTAGGVFMLIGQALALVRQLFTVICGPLTRIGDRVTLVRDPVALIGILVAAIRSALPVVDRPRDARRPSRLGISEARGAKPVTLALQAFVIGLELCGAALDRRAEVLDLGPGSLIVLVERATAQLAQRHPVRIELRELMLQCGHMSLKLGPLRSASCLPQGSRCFVACCALLVHEPRPNVCCPVRAGAQGRFHRQPFFGAC